MIVTERIKIMQIVKFRMPKLLCTKILTLDCTQIYSIKLHIEKDDNAKRKSKEEILRNNYLPLLKGMLRLPKLQTS